MIPVDAGRSNLVMPTGTDWSRTNTYYGAGTALALVTAAAALGAITITITNGSASPVTLTAGDLLGFGSDANLYEVLTGATIASLGTGTITIKGGGLAQQAIAALVTQYIPVNLTGYTARMQVRATPAATTTILSLTSSPPAGIVLGGTAGTITLTLTNAQLTEGVGGLDLSTITAPPGWLYEDVADGSRIAGYGKLASYDLELVDASGKVERVLMGQVVFDAETTR